MRHAGTLTLSSSVSTFGWPEERLDFPRTPLFAEEPRVHYNHHLNNTCAYMCVCVCVCVYTRVILFVCHCIYDKWIHSHVSPKYARTEKRGHGERLEDTVSKHYPRDIGATRVNTIQVNIDGRRHCLTNRRNGLEHPLVLQKLSLYITQNCSVPPANISTSRVLSRVNEFFELAS